MMNALKNPLGTTGPFSPNSARALSLLPLGAGVLLLMALLILPLPPWLLDLLLATNMVLCLLLLFSTLMITHRLSLSAFPSFLLVATLFRLGLNVASTRLILSEGQAGHLITSLGGLATGGSWAIGLVLFALLTLIQFLVIAKGAERVAEVGARFSLDALPGKQMSIDADLRAGVISQEQAKAQREELQQASGLFGSMDGAMKFVKGDAIAGVIITLINFFGGLFLGVMDRGLTFGQALESYSVLSIGDGLISQLTAQLVALSAAFMVTAVDDPEKQNSLSHHLSSQLLTQPKILSGCAVLLLVFSFIPGVTAYPFWILAAVLFMLRYVLEWVAKKRKVMEAEVKSEMMVHHEMPAQPMPLTLLVSPKNYQKMLTDQKWQQAFDKLYPKLKFYLSQKTGVLFPPLELRAEGTLKDSARYQIALWEVPMMEATLQDTNPVESLLRQLAQTLKIHAKEFLGIQEVQDRLRSLETQYPDLVRETVPKWITVQRLTEVLQRLAEEGVPIKDLRSILQQLAGRPSEDQDTVTLTEQVRLGLKRTLSLMYANRQNCLFAFSLDPQVEEEIRSGIRRQGQQCYLVLSPERMQELAEQFRREVENKDRIHRLKESGRPVILTQGELRRYVRKLIELALPEVPVLAYEELDPAIKLKSLGTLGTAPATLSPAEDFTDQEVTQLANVG